MAGVIVVLLGLGTWQVQRRAWKLDLIARVEGRVHASPVPAPGPAEWATLSADSAEYRHVQANGTFPPVPETRVAALTELGQGFWVLAPLRREDGSTVLVNRGFVSTDRRQAASVPPGSVVVTGLLRLSEPHGTLLRANDPAGDRWFSRDTAAIAAARGLGPVAPYFIDQEAGPADPDAPVGGLTVIRFANNHLVYALTWYGLAFMLAGACVHVVRTGRGASA